MKKAGSKKRQAKRSSLQSIVEREVIHNELNDRVDNELRLHVASFLADFYNNEPLPRFNLLTQEGAEQALVILNATQEQLERQARTARALKWLLQQTPPRDD